MRAGWSIKTLAAIAGWLVTVAVGFVYAVPGGVLVSPLMGVFRNDQACFWVIPVACLMLWLLFIGVAVVVSWLCAKKGWDGRCYWRAGFLFVLAAVTPLFLVDARPLDDDYSWDDIPSPQTDIDKSHALVMSLRGPLHPTNDVPTRLLVSYTNFALCAQAIENMWVDLGPDRAIMEKLDEFAGIGHVVSGTGGPGIRFVAIRNTAQRYWIYARLKAEQGKAADGIRHLAQLHSVAQKSLPHSRNLVHKMIWIAIAGGNIQTAFAIAASPACRKKDLRLLADGIPPFTDQQLSLRGAFIGDYLVCKEAVLSTKDADFLDLFVPLAPHEEPRSVLQRYGEIVGGGSSGSMPRVREHRPGPSFLGRGCSRVISSIAFKRNRTVRALRRLVEPMVDGAAKRPPDVLPADALVEAHFWRPDLMNVGGWLLINMMGTASYSRVVGAASRNKVFSDLLSLELHERLGEPVDIPDYFSGGKYFRDETTGAWTSAGPDAQRWTKDDIVPGKWY